MRLDPIGTPAVSQAMSGNGDPLRLREVVHVRLLECPLEPHTRPEAAA